MKKRILTILFLAIGFFNQAQDKKNKDFVTIKNIKSFEKDTVRNKKTGKFLFQIDKVNQALNIPNQGKTGTCWSFSTLSFLESEMIKNGQPEVKLSEMFIVRNAYIEKAIMYVRMHGSNNFSQGGAFHDIIDIIKKYGIVPEFAYDGKVYKSKMHNHKELEKVLKSSLDAIISLKKISNVWLNTITSIIDSYLGTPPKQFKYKGKTYTPKSFLKYTDLQPKDYIELSSFTHHPFYKQFILEVPDNWNSRKVYNIKMNELIQTIDYAIENDYSIAWGSDISEKGFSFKYGLAIVPKKIKFLNTDKGNLKDSIFSYPPKEKTITQEIRQKAFDNYTTTDDHGMHIIGKAHTPEKKPYYIVKNSWGTERNDLNGYFFASENFVKYKTIDILINKKAIPKEIKNKLNLD